MNESLTALEVQDTKDILGHFYGAQTQNWPISIKTLEVLGQLIEKTKACDGIMDLIPRPYGGGSAIRWGSKQVRNTVLRQLKANSGKHYITCMRASAASMRTDFYHGGPVVLPKLFILTVTTRCHFAY